MDDHAGPPMTMPNPPTAPNDNNPDHNSGRNASLGAVVLIAVGVLLFLNNLGLSLFVNIGDFWPLAISAWGVAQLTRSRTGCGLVWPSTMVVVGILLTLGNLHILRIDIGNIWPIFLIAAGIGMLFNRGGWQSPNIWGQPWSSRHAFGPGDHFRRKFFGNILHVNAVFSSVDRRIDSANFEGADLNSTFAELKIDFRGATISTPNREAIVQANASFGAIKLRVPETWKVVVQGAAIFGAFEDKTVPPRPAPGIDPPTLVIRGNSAFGAVEIEN